jgi:hypothetical protein
MLCLMHSHGLQVRDAEPDRRVVPPSLCSGSPLQGWQTPHGSFLLHFNNMRRYRQHTNQAHTFAASKSKSMAAIYGPVQEAHDLVGICLQLLSCAGRAAHLSIHSRQHRTKGSNVVHRKQEPLARAWLQVGRYSLQYLGVCLQQPQEHRSCGILLLEPE